MPSRDAFETDETQARETVDGMLLDQELLTDDMVLLRTDDYVTMRGWRENSGRPDLVDCVADEFERRPAVPAHQS